MTSFPQTAMLSLLCSTPTVALTHALLYIQVFEFLDKNSNRSLLGLFNWPGYGGLKNGPVFIDGIAHALVYNFAGDNAGPQSYDQYKSTYNQLQKTFPNAEIVFSTFDNYTQHILPLLGKGILPVIDKEVGDTWIYGMFIWSAFSSL